MKDLFTGGCVDQYLQDQVRPHLGLLLLFIVVVVFLMKTIGECEYVSYFVRTQVLKWHP